MAHGRGPLGRDLEERGIMSDFDDELADILGEVPEP